MKKQNSIKKSTICIHSGTYNDKKNPGLNTPIYTSTSYAYKNMDEIIYPRNFNTQNQRSVVKKLCVLEQAQDGLILSSGMAAISSALLSFLKTGEHVIFSCELYGGVYSFASTILKRMNIEYSFTKNLDIKSFEREIKANTKVIYFETPSNPLLQIIDLATISKLATANNILSIIDNTFATPINQNPLNFGINLVIHSGTKYLGGHHDIIFGAILGSKKYINKIRPIAINLGGNVNAITCYFIERSLKTLSIRVEKQNRNALAIANFLDKHPKINKVFYPGLGNYSMYKIAHKQMSGFGGMLSFALDTRQISIKIFIKNLIIIKPALSLGGVDSIICLPSKTSHLMINKHNMKELGINSNIIRLSVGIEDSDELINDIKNALDK